MEISNSPKTVRVAQHLNLENTPTLKKELAEMLEHRVSRVELDFSATQSIDSSGLGKLLLFNEKFREIGSEFKLTKVVHPNVVELFRLISLEKYITIEYRN